MRCKVRVLRDINVQGVTIPTNTLLVIDDDHVKIWVRGSGAPVNLRTKQVAITLEDSRDEAGEP